MRPRTPGSDRFAERVNQAVIRLDNSEPLSLVEAGTTGGSIYSDRRRHPSATVSYMRGMMSEFGITRLARVTGLDHVGVPVWSAIRPNAKTLAQSQGKGIDDPSAQASALMEAVEIATAERADLPARRATRRQLTSEGVVVDSIDVLLRKGGRRIADDEAVAWLSGSDLLSGQSVLVPYEAVTFSDASSPTRYWQTYDGLASGNTIWEAMLHGLCERIERDAMALWLLRDDDDVAARAYGLSLNRYKALAFIFGGFAAGVSGGIAAHLYSYINHETFNTQQSILALTIVILGGLGNVAGAIVGSVALVGLPEVFRIAAEYRILIYGIVLLLLVRFRPQGLLGTI